VIEDLLLLTKQLMREVSDVLRRDQPSMPSVMHHAAIDLAGFMTAAFSEAVVEGDALAWPESRGCSVEHGPTFAGDREAH